MTGTLQQVSTLVNRQLPHQHTAEILLDATLNYNQNEAVLTGQLPPQQLIVTWFVGYVFYEIQWSLMNMRKAFIWNYFCLLYQ